MVNTKMFFFRLKLNWFCRAGEIFRTEWHLELLKQRRFTIKWNTILSLHNYYACNTCCWYWLSVGNWLGKFSLLCFTILLTAWNQVKYSWLLNVESTVNTLLLNHYELWNRFVCVACVAVAFSGCPSSGWVFLFSPAALMFRIFIFIVVWWYDGASPLLCWWSWTVWWRTFLVGEVRLPVNRKIKIRGCGHIKREGTAQTVHAFRGPWTNTFGQHLRESWLWEWSSRCSRNQLIAAISADTTTKNIPGDVLW